jgi:hypothetical protein
MAKQDKQHARRAAEQTKLKHRRKLSNAKLSQRSQSAYDRSLHVLAAMRRDPKLSLTHAAKLEGVKRETVKRYFPSALKHAHGKFRVTKSDRNIATLYIPDAHGNSTPVNTRSSKDRQALSRYLRDLGRYLRGSRNALAPWHGKQIAGVALVTAGRTIVAIEPALSEFSLYRAFNGGAA